MKKVISLLFLSFFIITLIYFKCYASSIELTKTLRIPLHSGCVRDTKRKPNYDNLIRLSMRESDRVADLPVEPYIEMEESRYPFIGALKTIMQFVLDKFINDNIQLVVEMGAGRGFVFRHYIPEKLKPKWHQYEINKGVIKSAEDEFGLNIKYGNAYEIPDDIMPGSVDVWFSHSAYDSIGVLEVAFQIVYEALKSNGVIIIIQEAQPAEHPILQYAQNRLGDRAVTVEKDKGYESGYRIIKDGLLSIDYQSDLNERIEEALLTQGFNIRYSKKIVAVYIGPKEKRHEVKIGGPMKNAPRNLQEGFMPERIITGNYNIALMERKFTFQTFRFNNPQLETRGIGIILNFLYEMGYSNSDLIKLQMTGKLGNIPTELCQTSWIVSPEKPIIIIPEEMLESKGFVQEIAVVDVIIADKDTMPPIYKGNINVQTSM